MTLKQSICNTASCREVRKDIGRFLDELRQSDLNCPAEVVEKMTRWHHQLNVAGLADREEQFRTTIYSIGDGVITTDPNGRVDKMNPAAEKLTGWTGERFAYLNPAATTLYGADDPCRLDGTPVMDRIHPDFHEEVATRLQQMAGGDKAHDDSSQQLHLRCDGSHVWVDVVCSPIHHEGNESVLLFIRDITEQIEYEKQIRSNLREKEVMLAEIHHRVKNNLAVISGLLELEAGLSERPEIVDVLRKAENRVRSMALIHEKLYKSESLADIDFRSYITELADFVQGYFSRRNLDAEIHFDLEPVRLDVNRAVPCGIIVNEILTNGLKYAFAGREQGNITLILRESDGEIRLTYRDDGVGMPEETLEQLRAGRAPSLGLELISALTRQLNGTLDISSDGGTRIALRFPGDGE